MTRTLALLGGMLTRPLATLRTIATEGAAVWPPLVLLVVVTALVQLKVLLRLGFLLDEGGSTIGRRIREALLDDLDTDVFLLAITVAVLAVVAQLLTKGAVRPQRAAIAGVWLLVPLLVLKCVGGALDVTLGNDARGMLWWLPHTAVDSMSVVVDKQVSWLRVVVKCVVAYGPPLAMALALVASWRRSPAETGPLPGGARTWAGLGVVGAATLALAVTAGVSAAGAADRIRPLQPGDVLPDVALRKLDVTGVSKQKVKLSQFQGKVLVLDFWASWCTPCRRSMPELSTLQDELGPRGLVVLGVNREPREPQEAAEALAEIKPRFESVIDDRYFGDKIGLTTLPTSYVVDKKGVVRHLHLGYVEPTVVRAEIEALLAE